VSIITSVHNPKVQWVRRLLNQPRARREEAAFVVEGVRLVEEALQAGWPVRLVLHAPGLSGRGLALVAQFNAQGVNVEPVSENVLASASDTETPQGILAVVQRQELPLPASPDFLLIADALRDPGNTGTLLRTAAAAGVQGMLVTPGSVDPFAPKVLRAAMGAHFRLPILSLDWQAIAALVHPSSLPLSPQESSVPHPLSPQEGEVTFPLSQAYLYARERAAMRSIARVRERITVFLADSSAGQAHTAADLTLPLALVVGGEAEGAGRQAELLADARLHIPMSGQVESLNAAVAGAVLMFEVARQRMAQKG
jgi:RNA methyltransferase, TrmH family